MNLSDNQKTYIRGNHKRQSVSEMARNLKIDASDVLEFMTQAKLATVRPCVLASRREFSNPYKKKAMLGYNDKTFFMMDFKFAKHVTIVCHLSIGETVRVNGWGPQLDGKDWIIEDIKFDPGVDSAIVVKINGYKNYLSSNWLTKIN